MTLDGTNTWVLRAPGAARARGRRPGAGGRPRTWPPCSRPSRRRCPGRGGAAHPRPPGPQRGGPVVRRGGRRRRRPRARPRAPARRRGPARRGRRRRSTGSSSRWWPHRGTPATRCRSCCRSRARCSPATPCSAAARPWSRTPTVASRTTWTRWPGSRSSSPPAVSPTCCPGTAPRCATRSRSSGSTAGTGPNGWTRSGGRWPRVRGRRAEVVERVYADVPREVWPAAELSVRAQLDHLRTLG